MPQTISFNANDVITPASYSSPGVGAGVLVQFAKNGVPFGMQLNQNSFAISINQVAFGANSYTYCPNTSSSIAISVIEPAQGGPWTYNWTPGGLSGNPINVSPIVNTTYFATATSLAGCTSTVAVAVTISCTPTGCCIGNNCADVIKNPLTSDWQVPLGNFNYVFNRGVNKTGKVGIGAIGSCSPGNLLEVKKGATNNISGLRLTDLALATPLASNNKALSIDASGDVILVSTPAPGITNACATTNYIPKTTTGGNLICSQIFDNATSVGIGAAGPFNYTSLSVVGVSPVPATGTVKLFVNGVTKASAYFATSDQRFKKQIAKIENASDIIKKLEGKSYYWKHEEFKDHGFNSTKQFGFIAQELEKVIPEAVATDENGYKSVNYDMIIPILVQGAKEQSSVIDNLQKQIDELKNLVQSLATTISIDGIKNTNSQTVNLSDKNAIVLNQNVPNPFAESTVINYNIPSDFTKAQIIFTTVDGKIIKAIDINVKGSGTLNVFANDLTSGLYSYSLIVDNKLIDTKKMVKE
ncbi:MAG: tail fiber domain-containing protein [Bacteroidetes bacterium]|nr:tail fiber domain-containing protein [Bacteroidota bacterium]